MDLGTGMCFDFVFKTEMLAPFFRSILLIAKKDKALYKDFHTIVYEYCFFAREK